MGLLILPSTIAHHPSIQNSSPDSIIAPRHNVSLQNSLILSQASLILRHTHTHTHSHTHMHYLHKYRLGKLLSVDDLDCNSFSSHTMHAHPHQPCRDRQQSCLPRDTVLQTSLHTGHRTTLPLLTLATISHFTCLAFPKRPLEQVRPHGFRLSVLGRHTSPSGGPVNESTKLFPSSCSSSQHYARQQSGRAVGSLSFNR